MADFSISLTVPDNKVTELVAAMRWHYGEKSEGVEYSQAELRGLLKTSVENSLKNIFTRHKVYLRDQGALKDDLSLT